MAGALCACVLCGLPAAGKSSLARLIATHLQKRGWNTFIIPYDDVIGEDAFHVNSSKAEDDSLSKGQTRWKQQRQAVLWCVDSFLQESQAPRACEAEEGVWRRFKEAMERQQVQPALQRPLSEPTRIALLLDDNFYYQSMRYEVYQLARKYSVGFCQLYLHCPVEVCLHRNQVRGHPVPEEVILDMSKRMEPPNAMRNQWERSSLHLNSSDSLSDTDIQKVVELMCSALENPPSPLQDDSELREADRQRCANSILHQVDQSCRRLVSDAMLMARDAKVPGGVMKALAKELAEVKCHFLQELRGHVLHAVLPVCVGETLDTERVVSRALTTFQRQRDDVLQRHGVRTREDMA